MQLKTILGFPSFYNVVKDQKMPIKTAYKLSRLAKSIETEIQFYQEKLREIIQKHAILDEEGQPVFTEGKEAVKLIEGHETECYTEIQELQDLDVEIPDITFTLDEFANVELTLDEMNNFMPFIQD